MSTLKKHMWYALKIILFEILAKNYWRGYGIILMFLIIWQEIFRDLSPQGLVKWKCWAFIQFRTTSYSNYIFHVFSHTHLDLRNRSRTVGQFWLSKFSWNGSKSGFRYISYIPKLTRIFNMWYITQHFVTIMAPVSLVPPVSLVASVSQMRYLNAAHAISHYFTNPAFFRIIYDLPRFPALFGVFRI